MTAPTPLTATRKARIEGHLAMLVFSVIVAGSNSFGKLIAGDIDPAALTAVRFALAAVLLGGGLAATGRLNAADFRAPWRYLPLGAAYATFFVLMFEALKTTSPVSTSAIFTMMPFIAALLGWGLFRQRNAPLVWLALMIGAFGALWVVFRGSLSALLGFGLGRGELLYLVGTAAHAAYAVLVPHLRRGEPVYTVTLGVAVSGGVILTVMFFSHITSTNWAALPLRVWIVLAYLSILAGIGTFSLVTIAAQRLSPAKVTAYTYLTPFWVVLMEMGLGHGVPKVAVLLGGLPIILALILLFYESEPPRPRQND